MSNGKRSTINTSELLATFDSMTLDEMEAVSGGRMNSYPDGIRPLRPQRPDSYNSSGAGYFLPEMEMDTGIVYLPG